MFPKVRSLGFARVAVLYFDNDFESGQSSDFQLAALRLGLSIEHMFKLPSGSSAGPAIEAALEKVNREPISTRSERRSFAILQGELPGVYTWVLKKSIRT